MAIAPGCGRGRAALPCEENEQTLTSGGASVELRRSDGWVYGPVRDDEQKQHPCLVSYEALADADKAYDRAIAMATLKAVVALGYSIRRADGG